MPEVDDLPIVPAKDLADCPCFSCPLTDCHPMSSECPINGCGKTKNRQMDWGSVPAATIAWLKRRATYYAASRQLVIRANQDELLAHGITNPPRKMGHVFRLTLSSSVLIKRMGY